MKIVAIFTLIAFIVGVECANQQLTNAMKKYKVIPDVVSNGADQQLEIVYENDEVSYPGYEMKPIDTKNKPIEVNWSADDDAYYTLIFTAPDAPTPSNRTFSEVIKWLVVNIAGKDIDSGDELAEYIGAGPPKDAGLTRYVFLVYKQNGKQNFDETPIDKNSFEPRKKFSTKGFTQKHNMGPSIEAANFFLARYDEYTDVINKQLNCCEDY